MTRDLSQPLSHLRNQQLQRGHCDEFGRQPFHTFEANSTAWTHTSHCVACPHPSCFARLVTLEKKLRSIEPRSLITGRLSPLPHISPSTANSCPRYRLYPWEQTSLLYFGLYSVFPYCTWVVCSPHQRQCLVFYQTPIDYFFPKNLLIGLTSNKLPRYHHHHCLSDLFKQEIVFTL